MQEAKRVNINEATPNPEANSQESIVRSQKKIHFQVWSIPNPEGVESSYPRVQPGAGARRGRAKRSFPRVSAVKKQKELRIESLLF